MLALATELTERGADWQLHAYGHAMHAFMAPFANAPERGIQYERDDRPAGVGEPRRLPAGDLRLARPRETPPWFHAVGHA